MRIDEWDFSIIKEFKGPQHVPQVTINVVNFLKIFAYFYLREFDNSYIWVYGADVAPLKLPWYLTDRMVFMEFVR